MNPRPLGQETNDTHLRRLEASRGCRCVSLDLPARPACSLLRSAASPPSRSVSLANPLARPQAELRGSRAPAKGFAGVKSHLGPAHGRNEHLAGDGDRHCGHRARCPGLRWARGRLYVAAESGWARSSSATASDSVLSTPITWPTTRILSVWTRPRAAATSRCSALPVATLQCWCASSPDRFGRG